MFTGISTPTLKTLSEEVFMQEEKEILERLQEMMGDQCLGEVYYSVTPNNKRNIKLRPNKRNKENVPP